MIKLRDVYGMDLVKKGVYFGALLSARTEVIKCTYEGKVQERHELNGGRVLTYVNDYTVSFKDNLTDEIFTLKFVARGVNGEFTYFKPTLLIKNGRYYQAQRYLTRYTQLIASVVSTIRTKLGEC